MRQNLLFAVFRIIGVVGPTTTMYLGTYPPTSSKTNAKTFRSRKSFNEAFKKVFHHIVDLEYFEKSRNRGWFTPTDFSKLPCTVPNIRVGYQDKRLSRQRPHNLVLKFLSILPETVHCRFQLLHTSVAL